MINKICRNQVYIIDILELHSEFNYKRRINVSERVTISRKTERMLWAMTAGRCEKCGRLIYKHPLSGTIGNFAQIAHSLPVAQGARSEYKKKYKTIDPNLDVNNIDNLLLLCYDCHQEIDKINADKYPPEVLRRIKGDFQEFVLKATNIKRNIATIAIRYSANLHNSKLQITGIYKALFPDKYIEKEFDLTLKNSEFHVGDTNFWQLEEQNLIRRYNHTLLPELENYNNTALNLSVFAIGPIPLLVKLGSLLSNKQSVDVYQLKKSPVQSWEWESTDDDTDYEVTFIQQNANPQKIVLILSLSGLIRHEEVRQAVDWEYATVVEVKTNHKPSDDYLRNKRQLEKFVRCYQQLKERLRNLCKTNIMVHVFAAVPVSIAVEIGRHRNPTTDLPMTIYNYTKGAYEKAIIIGE